MNAFSFAQQLSAFQLDDSTAAVLALLVGIIGGWHLTGLHNQLKAKRAKIAQRPRVMPRNRD